MMLNLQIALEYLLHFIVIQWIYEKTSLVKDTTYDPSYCVPG